MTPTSPAALVSVKELSISYRADGADIPVVRDASFTVRPGRTLGIIGESGSGKSTIARTILAYLRPGSQVTTGSVTVDGEDVFSLDPAEVRALRGGTAAVVPQNAALSLTPSMRIAEQLRETLASHGEASGADQVTSMLRKVHLPDPDEIGRRYPHQLSGGQQQRVVIAMAIAARPRVLVLDEPTTSLDVMTQSAVLELIRDLAAEFEIAVLLVSHDLGVVSAMADDIAVMRDGVIVEQATVEEFFRQPKHEYSRALLAATPALVIDADERDAPLPEAPPLISVRDVSIRYAKRAPLAVDQVSLEFGRQETFALVGESGSGKSTFAMAVAGLLPVSSGNLTFHNQSGEHNLATPIAKRSLELRRSIQLIFQNADASLNPRRTVGTAIGRPMKFFTGSTSKQRIGELLEQVGLPAGFQNRLPAQLSGGQRQRVGIARALAAHPDLIIADEITTALDVQVQAGILELLADLKRERSLGCLFVSHDLAVVQGIADRIAVMRHGQIVECGPAARVFAGPNHPYTASLLSATLEPGVMELPVISSEPNWVDEKGWLDQGEGHLIRNWKRRSN